MKRAEALARLRAQVDGGKPIIGAGAWTGLSAKCVEAGGADLIIIYNSGRYRMAGRGSLSGLLPYGDANAIVVEMSREVLPVDVSVEPGQAHDFHRHPGQEEMIIVKAGEIEQWVEQEAAALGPGDSVFIGADLVHATFNDGDETVHLQVVLGPAIDSEIGYGVVDVSGETPWSSLRSGR
jgi:mannose-6-phosphate isomerase-like protein (cupin superfamily)